ncbi:MAG: FAD-binding protein [Saprospiraceae bacterium]|nr:FAD-binding protein [Saprospiraceae bacterium]
MLKQYEQTGQFTYPVPVQQYASLNHCAHECNNYIEYMAENLNGIVQSDYIAKQYSQNITEYSELDIPAVLKPTTLDEVQEIVRFANRYKLPLHPISTGKTGGKVLNCRMVKDKLL